MQISAADYRKHQTRLQKWRDAYRAAQGLTKDFGGCQRIIQIDKLVDSGECHAFARAILTEDYEYEAHLSDSDFFNRVAPFVAAYPSSFELNWPKHFELAKEFALLELVGEMSKLGTHFETLGNVDFDTGQVIYYNLDSGDLEFKIHSLFPDFAFPKKLEICKQCTEADDCEHCFYNNKNAGVNTFEDERVFRRDVRNAYILRDLETMRFLLKE